MTVLKSSCFLTYPDSVASDLPDFSSLVLISLLVGSQFLAHFESLFFSQFAMARSRSRTRDALPPSDHGESSDLPSGVTRYLVWGNNPTLRRLRRVLVHVLEDVYHADAMSAARCASLPCLEAQKKRHCSPTHACYRFPGSRSSLLEYCSPALASTSKKLGKFNLIEK